MADDFSPIRQPARQTSNSTEFQAFIDYYASRGFFKHIQKICDDLLKAVSRADPAISFWRAFSLAQQGQNAEALRTLEGLRDSKEELNLAVIAALINVYKAENIDSDKVTALKEQLKVVSKTSNSDALLFAGRYFWHADKAKQGRQCIEKVLTKEPGNVVALGLMGWLNQTSKNSRYEKKAGSFFDDGIKSKQGGPMDDIVCLLGQAAYFEKQGQNSDAINALNQVIVLYPVFLPALVEKARVLMLQNNWDEVAATLDRVLKKDKGDVAALRMKMFLVLRRQNDPKVAMAVVSDLCSSLETREPKSAALFYETSRLLARVANRQPAILHLAVGLMDRAVKLVPDSPDFLCESAYQMLLLEEYDRAQSYFITASKIEESNLKALYGRIHCKILMGQLEEAGQELEFLQEIKQAGSNAELLFLTAKLDLATGKGGDTMNLLEQAIKEHMAYSEQFEPGFDYLVAFNPDFVMELIDCVMNTGESAPASSRGGGGGGGSNGMLDSVMVLLQKLNEVVPGNVRGQLQLARMYFAAGQLERSSSTLANIISEDPQNSMAYLFQARISLAREDYEACSSALDQAKSLNFEIRNTPEYHLVKANLATASGQLEEACKLLEAAMNIPGVRRKNPKYPHTLKDRIALFLETASVHAQLGHGPESKKYMSDAVMEFGHTQEGARIKLTEADMLVQNKDYDGAIKILGGVDKTSPHYVKAKMQMADIALLHQRDRKTFIACYKELAYQLDSTYAYSLLSQAYMRIQEPQKAIRQYERALQKCGGKDIHLSCLIGRALITTHDYARAVAYYEDASANNMNSDVLIHELAELYIKLKHFNRAINLVDQLLHQLKEKEEQGGDSTNSLRVAIKSARIKATAYRGLVLDKVNVEDCERLQVEALEMAQKLLHSLLIKLKETGSADRNTVAREAADVTMDIAQFHQRSEPFPHPKATALYQEALKLCETHEGSRMALAKIQLSKGDLASCEEHCTVMLRLEPGHQEANMMLADMLVSKNEPAQAIVHFTATVEKDPTQYQALDKLIRLLRSCGRGHEIPRFLQLAEAHSPRARFDPGYNYCKGLHARYQGKPRDALNSFNMARVDGVWGYHALINMIEIYLNPDNQELFTDATGAKGAVPAHMEHATKLLQELATRHQFEANGDTNYRVVVMSAYVLMASKSKQHINSALNSLASVLHNLPDYVPALLGMSNAFMLLNQSDKAKNQLKRISKLPVVGEFIAEFEKSWLMLADMYIQIGKFETAQELCKRCLTYNQASAKSWEMLAQIAEKECSYKDAGDNYETAWNLMNESSASVGYKLAFNLMKAQRYVEAITVCQKVLQQFPNYPRIKTEIMDKARMLLRT